MYLVTLMFFPCAWLPLCGRHLDNSAENLGLI